VGGRQRADLKRPVAPLSRREPSRVDSDTRSAPKAEVRFGVDLCCYRLRLL
jgi:hypothetical protein